MKGRRILVTVVVYLAVASLVLGTARTVAEVLILPPSFLTFLAGFAVLGLPLAVVLAWTYRGSGDDD